MTCMISRRAFGTLGAAAFLAAALPANAADISGAAAGFVQSLGERALSTINDASLGDADRKVRFRKLFLDGFDVPAIGRFVLGKYWRVATDDEKSEFLRLFEEMVIRTYSARFKDFGGVNFKVNTSRAEGEDHAMVASQIVFPDGKPPVRIDWRVLSPKGQLKIVDVLVEGVSMSVTQQEEFSSLIQRQGGQVSGLIQHLRGQS